MMRRNAAIALVAALVPFLSTTPTGTVDAQVAGGPNLALSGTATQSSTYPGDDRGAELAIDGNTEGKRDDRSTTHTNKELNPWWQVELADVAEIGEVTVWNRTDCCAGRLSNFWVFTSAEPFASNDPAALIDDPNVSSHHVTTRPSPNLTVDFEGTPARYVRVQIQGTQFLSLAEVEIAAGQPPATFPRVTQSSTYARGFNRDASLAFDGNTNGTDTARSTSHTKNEQNPWWQVELENTMDLGSVTIWNRTDCCANRLSNFWVFASDQPFASDDLNALIDDPNVAAHHLTARPSPQLTVNFDGIPARFVRVQIEGTNHLSLAEVELAPHQPASSYPSVTQSTTHYGGLATRALDGDVNGVYNQGSVTHTHPADSQPWLNIELTGDDKLRAVEIWHRTDSRIERNDNLIVKGSQTNANACTQGADYEGGLARAGRRANRFLIGPKFGLGTQQEAFPIKSVCITKADGSPLSVAEVILHYGTVGTDGDDNFTASPDQMFAGWIGPVNGGPGNDTFSMWANRYGDATFRDALEKGFVPSETNQGYQVYQRHNYGATGDDVFNMGFPEHVDDDQVRMGHHVYGGEGRDTFNFVDIDNVRSDIWVFGRIDDFEVTEDTIQIDGTRLDFDNLPSNVRLVKYRVPNSANLDHVQQWLLIENDKGGHIFYAIEGARYNPDDPAHIYYVEQHFIRAAPNVDADLVNTTLEDTIPYVPYDERRGLSTTGLPYGSGIGTDADELFQGTSGAGTSYDQHVFAGGGDDLIGLGPSADSLFGEQGNDRMWGGTDEDVLDGGSGNDYLDGGIGDDELRGGQGNDELRGGQGDDRLSGDAGTGLGYWQFPLVVANRYDKNTDTEEESLTNGKTLIAHLPRFFSIQDDDGSLDNTDASSQVVQHHAHSSKTGSTVNLKGIIPVRNTKTGATANAYQLEVVHLTNPDRGYLPTKTLWVFDQPDFVVHGNPIEPAGDFRPIDGVAYDQLARQAESTDSRGGLDVFVFDDNSGNDTIVDFEVGIDKLRLPASAQGTVTITSDGGVPNVSFANTSVRLESVDFGDFSPADITFG